jgi:folate-binding protein YgfZ
MGALRFSGPDAAAFLQGQVSNDTAALARGSPVLAAYSTPQGRVLAVMHLLPHSNGVLAILPLELAAPIRDRLRKFVLRSKVVIEDVSARTAVAGADTAALSAAGLGEPPGPAEYRESRGMGIASVRRDAPSDRCWLVGDAASMPLDAAPMPLDAVSTPLEAADRSAAIEEAWRLRDIRDGLPQVYAATSELFVAQMLNLDLIGGISFSKGCYTGQEIIARTQHLGRIKRRMSRLHLPQGTWAIGQTLRLGDGRSGRLAELARVSDGFEALAVLSIEPGAADPESAAEPAAMAEELPLPYRTTG